MVMVAEETTVAGVIVYETVVRGIVRNIGSESFVAEISRLRSVDSHQQEAQHSDGRAAH